MSVLGCRHGRLRVALHAIRWTFEVWGWACHSPPAPLNTSRTSSGPFAPNTRQCVQTRLLLLPPATRRPGQQFKPCYHPNSPRRRLRQQQHPRTRVLDLADLRNVPDLSAQRDSMHPFSILTLGIFVAGYITARWDLVTRLYELAIFAWDYGVVVSCRCPPFAPPPSPSPNPLHLLRNGTAHMQLLTTTLPCTCAVSGHQRLRRSQPHLRPHIYSRRAPCHPRG